MLFSVSKVPFDGHASCVCTHPIKDIGFRVFPNRGGLLNRLWLRFEDSLCDVIEGYNDYEAIKSDPFCKSAILFPFPNRLADGAYRFDGVSYEFPINEAWSNNAIHGFKDFHRMKYVSAGASYYHGEIGYRYQYDGSNPAYPFACELFVEYKVTLTNEFECRFRVRNTGNQPMPMGLGWHPYFRLPAGTVDDWCLRTPPLENMVLDSRMLPTGERVAVPANAYASLRGCELDHSFTFVEQPQDGIAKIYLSTADNRYEICYWQETGKGKFNYLQLYTPPHRKSIAIEPMTCGVNGFNTGEGLIVLAPDEAFESRVGVKVLSKNSGQPQA